MSGQDPMLGCCVQFRLWENKLVGVHNRERGIERLRVVDGKGKFPQKR